MATLNSGEQKNKLELYLNDVYENECEFKIEQEEIEFIQTGIETLVRELVDLIVKHDSFDKEVSEEFDHTFEIGIDLYNDKTLVEVYFPIQSDCFLQRYVTENARHITFAKSTIIKVGSFYDGTKNNFPDEFDFIFPVLGIMAHCSIQGFSNYIQLSVSEALCTYRQSLHYPPVSEEHQGTRKLYIEEDKGQHGPACKIQFIYSNGFGEQRPIHVDLVPAYMIIDSNTQQWFVEEVRQCVEPKTFCKEILSARNCLYVNGILAFTEIEQHFIKNILSKKHVKVYRILKHLLNGNGDSEKLEEYINEKMSEYPRKRQCIYTSYRIKILMIYHHESCTNTDTEDLGPCVLRVLKEMSQYQSSDKFPSFSTRFRFQLTFGVLPYLKSTIRTLQSMQSSEKDYNYERDKIKSVSGNCLDRKTRRCCVIS